MLRKIFLISALVVFVGCTGLLALFYLPRPTVSLSTLQTSYSVSPTSLIRFVVVYPGKTRIGGMNVIRVSAELEPLAGPQLPEDSESPSDTLVYQLVMNFADIHPGGSMECVVNSNAPRSVTWNFLSNQVGSFEGVLWVFLKSNGPEMDRTPIFAIPLQIQNTGPSEWTVSYCIKLGIMISALWLQGYLLCKQLK